MFSIVRYVLSALVLGWYVFAQSEGRTFMGSSYKNKNRTTGYVNHK